MQNSQRHTQPILVTGGAGYIGSHMVKLLQQHGYTPIVLDNLSTGLRARIKDALFIEGDVSDIALVEQIHRQYGFTSVIHFAAFIQVGESTQNPLKYYQNNVASTVSFLQTLTMLGIKTFVFSSSAAVYGEPVYDQPIKEDHPTQPVNPYGQTKLMMEHILRDCARAYGLNYAALRYFNVAGVDKHIPFGVSSGPVTHLIPLVLQAASGRRPSIAVYGRDYATPDGTCIRDYVHVKDLCEAHLLALQALWNNDVSFTYNLGTGRGYSVQEVIKMSNLVTNMHIPIINSSRRAGDPARLVADGSMAQRMLNWTPRFSSLEQIIKDAWAYEMTAFSSVQ